MPDKYSARLLPPREVSLVKRQKMFSEEDVKRAMRALVRDHVIFTDENATYIWDEDGKRRVRRLDLAGDFRARYAISYSPNAAGGSSEIRVKIAQAKVRQALANSLAEMLLERLAPGRKGEC